MDIWEIGNLGHALLLLSFISAGLAGTGFVGYSSTGSKLWWRYGCCMYVVHAVVLCTAAGLLFYLLATDTFIYHYVWSHSMQNLPISYKIAAFWEGQEGSFLLWMLWQLLFGAWIICKGGKLRAEVLSVLCLVQLCLASMLLGVAVGTWEIGSSPFLLLRESLESPIFATNPTFWPADGTGLSPLLQNYWMVIHPPVLFMGFALTLLPYAYACAGLWRKEVSLALHQAVPWVLLAILVLGVGIILGAIWAYETLNFGGYWNWDPVENAVYVPWLVLIASLHMLILHNKKGVALRGSLFSLFAALLLVLYATFLIRSGILGDTSVHAFTDAGLSAQLIGFMFVISALFIGLFIWRRKWLVRSRHFSYSPYEAEVYLGAGIVCLSLMAFQVLLPTSLPVWNALWALVGVKSSLAPPADAVGFYSQTQLYFVIGILLLSSVGQLVYWSKVTDRPTLLRVLFAPLLPTLLAAACIIIFAGMQTLSWIWLLSACLYAFFTGIRIFSRMVRKQPKYCSGALAHTGFACMVIGILFSSGYSKIVSTNHTGLLWHEDFPEEVNTNDMLLFQHKTHQMKGYTLVYKGIMKRLKGFSSYVPTAHLKRLEPSLLVQATVDIFWPQSTSFFAKKGDTLRLESPDKDYFAIAYQPEDEKSQMIYPSAQHSLQNESVLYNPFILRGLFEDVYTHVRTFSLPDEAEWSEAKKIEVAPKTHFFANDYVARILNITRLDTLEDMHLEPSDVALSAEIEVLGPDRPHNLRPILVLKEDEMGIITDESIDLGIRIALIGVFPKRNTLALNIRTTQSPWVIIEVVKKPLINLLWIGMCVLVLGLLVGIMRHLRTERQI